MKVINEVEKLFVLTTPKLLLNHYWEILDLIAWRIFVGQEEKNHFTLSNLKEKILTDIQSSKSNPIRYRECLNSMKVADEVVNKMVKSGLLIKKENTFIKSDVFSTIFYLLKTRIKNSAKKRVAWALFYLYKKGLTHFSTTEIIRVLSYSDEECEEEIPYLVKWENNRWISLLEKCDEGWKLLRTPYRPSKSILLVDINYRLHASISKLSNLKDRFTTREIIKKLREIESKNLERILSRFGLKNEKGKWFIDSKIYEKIRKILLTEVEIKRWPLFGIIPSTNPYFKIEGRAHNIYVDMPNMLIAQFLDNLYKLSKKYGNDLKTLREEALKVKDEFNKIFKETVGNWISLSIRRETWGKRPMGIQIKIDWKQFFTFLDNFAKKEISLKEKYSYLLNCRAPSLTLVLRGDLERVRYEVKEVCKGEIEQICKKLEELINKIDEIKDYLFKISSYRKTIPIEPATLEYFPEMISTLGALVVLIKNGTIPSCYREMRKILENLSWVIFDDLLFYKMISPRKKKHGMELPLPYRHVSKEWYEWASQNNLIVRNLRELERKAKNLVEIIYFYSKSKGYGWKKKQIERVFFETLSYPLFLLLTGIETHVPKKLEHLIPCYKVKTLEELTIENLENILRDLKCSRYLSKSDRALINKLINSLEMGQSLIVPPYPSNEFVLGFVSKVFSNNLLKLYKEYSHFVHSYLTSWHIFPFSSVLEFKIFRNELSIFTEALLQILNSYLEQLFLDS